MSTSRANGYRFLTWSLLFLFFCPLGTLDGPAPAQATERADTHNNNVTVLDIIEQLHSDIVEQVDQKKLPEERRSEAAMLKRSYAKRQIELNARLEILKIDALAPTDNKAEIIEELINTAIAKERMVYEYLIRLQMLRNPSAKYEPASVTQLPFIKSSQTQVMNQDSKSNFSIKWVPEAVTSGEHD